MVQPTIDTRVAELEAQIRLLKRVIEAFLEDNPNIIIPGGSKRWLNR